MIQNAAATDDDLSRAGSAVETARAVVDSAARHLAASGAGAIDAQQAVAYDLAHGAAAVETARAALTYGSHGPEEAALACAFAAEAVWDLAGRLLGREEAWGQTVGALDPALAFVRSWRDPGALAALARTPGRRHLDSDFEMVADTFRRFGEERIVPVAERIHRHNEDIPEDVISGLGELGAFGLSIPEEYGGYATGGEHDYMGMVIATEELSRASLGAGGSLITRPEILARALLKGGTEEQKQHWLPRLASGEVMAGVAVTEPDFGSDVAGITLAAVPVDGAGTGGAWSLSGTKTWSTFAARADVLMVLARTDPDRSKGH
ncbi:MAG TPA: acyl-CoA dehydrogenase family protein, partial [Acidimicrobiales bacterium]|nr:acyl-CoA dehydrogenase family protein [Acidimicrobiales bacterium]